MAVSNKPMIPKVEIDRAKGDRSHLVAKVLDDGWLVRYNALYNSLRGTTGEESGKDLLRQRWREEILCPISGILEGQRFTLEPLDLVSIWSLVWEKTPVNLHFKYDLAWSIASSFGNIAFLPQIPEAWQGFFRKTTADHWLNYLMRLVSEDPQNVKKFLAQMDKIRAAECELEYYIHGTREDPFKLVNIAYGSSGKKLSDQERADADRRVNEILAWQKANKDHSEDFILSQILENWGNGLGPAVSALRTKW